MKKIFLIWLFFIPSLCWGTNYYTDNRCTYNGSGTVNSCASSAGQPGAFNSVSNMVAKPGGYTDGDIIDGNSLTYYERMVIPSGGTSSYITFRNFILDGTVSLDGTYSYYQNDSYGDGSNIVANGTLETYTGVQDDGGSTTDAFASWTASRSGTALVEATATSHAGASAVKLTTGDSIGSMRQTFLAAPGSYTLTYWTRGDGTAEVRHRIYDLNTPGWLVTLANSGNKTTTYTQITVPFTIPEGCVSFYLDFLTSSVAGDCYVDDVVISSSTGWVNLTGSAVWRKQFHPVLFEMYENGVKLTPSVQTSEANAKANLTKGQFSTVSAGTTRGLYYRATDDAAPLTHLLRGTQHYAVASTPSNLLNIDTKNYIKLSNITLKSWAVHSSYTSALGVDDSDYFYADNVEILDSSTGATFKGGSTSVYLNLNVHDNIIDGIGLTGGGDYEIIGQYKRNGRYQLYEGNLLSYKSDGDNIGIGQGDGGTFTNISIHDAVVEDAGPPDANTTDVFGSGIYVGSATDFVLNSLSIYRCTISGSHLIGLYVDSKNVLSWNIYYNIFSNNAHVPGNSYHAVTLGGSHSPEGQGDMKFDNNTLALNHGGSTLWVVSAYGNVYLRNNIFYNADFNSESTTKADVWFGDNLANLTNYTESNNFYSRNGTSYDFDPIIRTSDHTYTRAQLADWQSASSKGVGDISGTTDPRFTSSTNFHLLPGSPAINAGIDVGLTEDLESNSVPYGAAPDIGAYEYRPLHFWNF